MALVDWQPKPMAGLALSCLRFCQALVALPEAVQARLIKCCVPNRAQHTNSSNQGPEPRRSISQIERKTSNLFSAACLVKLTEPVTTNSVEHLSAEPQRDAWMRIGLSACCMNGLQKS